LGKETGFSRPVLQEDGIDKRILQLMWGFVWLDPFLLPDAELGGGLEESLPDGREGKYEVSV
jgi:hypothetical protein